MSAIRAIPSAYELMLSVAALPLSDSTGMIGEKATSPFKQIASERGPFEVPLWTFEIVHFAEWPTARCREDWKVAHGSAQLSLTKHWRSVDGRREILWGDAASSLPP